MRELTEYVPGEPWCPDGVYRVDYTSVADGTRDWALVRPPESGRGDWIVNLHGHGSTGDQLYTRADLGPRKDQFLAAGFGILTPNLRGNAWMCPAAVQDLHALLEHLRVRHGAQRFVFYSGSMGGTSTLIYAVRYPEDVAGLAALCPATDLPSYYDWLDRGDPPVLNEIQDAIRTAYRGSPKTRPDVFAANSALANAERLTMPVALVHGDADATIPVEQTRRLVQRLRDMEATFTYRELSGGHHDSPITGADGMLEWVLDALG